MRYSVTCHTLRECLQVFHGAWGALATRQMRGLYLVPKNLTPSASTPGSRQSETVKAPLPPTGVKRRLINTALPVFWLLFAINTVNYFDRFLAVAVAPTLKSEFHLTDGNIGALSSAFILIYTLAALPLGLLADRASRARVVSVGIAIWSVASGLTGVATGSAAALRYPRRSRASARPATIRRVRRCSAPTIRWRSGPVSSVAGAPAN